MDLVEKLIAYDYLAKEIPPEFQTEDLANTLKYLNLSIISNENKNKWTKSVSFNIPKTKEFRRTIGVPSPIHQIQLCQLINDRWKDLLDHYNLSSLSMTKPKISTENKKAIESEVSIQEKMHIRMKHLHNKNYILQTDISRYYPTIYTHVIPWALHTKKYAKENINKKSLLGNKIDKRLQCIQDGQTFGHTYRANNITDYF